MEGIVRRNDGQIKEKNGRIVKRKQRIKIDVENAFRIIKSRREL